MRHESAGIAGLLGDAGTALVDRGLPMVQSLVAGGEVHLPSSTRVMADDTMPSLAVRAESLAIAAVRRHATDAVVRGEARWKEIRCRVTADEGGTVWRLRLVAQGVAPRPLEGDVLAGAAAALALLAGMQAGSTITDLRVYAIDIEGRGRRLHADNLPADVAAMLPPEKPALAGSRCAVVTLSDRASRGVYEDKSGERLSTMLAANGGEVVHRAILPDDAARLMDEIRVLSARGDIALVLCTGGTGIGPRDITPESLIALGIRPVPGIGELLRRHSAHIVRSAWLSRAVAGTLGNMLVIALPGSHKAVSECLEALLPLLPHTLSMLQGGGHD